MSRGKTIPKEDEIYEGILKFRNNQLHEEFELLTYEEKDHLDFLCERFKEKGLLEVYDMLQMVLVIILKRLNKKVVKEEDLI